MLAPQRTVLGKCMKSLPLRAASARDMETPRLGLLHHQSESSWDEDTCLRVTLCPRIDTCRPVFQKGGREW